MPVTLLRAAILLSGWPVLVIGSVLVIYQAWHFYRDLEKSIFGRLALLMSLGWFVSMYSLGIIATFFMWRDPQVGVLITLPIFLVWIGTMLLISTVVWRLRKEAVGVMKKYLQLESELKAKNQQLESEKVKLEKANEETKIKVRDLERINRLMIGREIRIKKLKEKVRKLEEK